MTEQVLVFKEDLLKKLGSFKGFYYQEDLLNYYKEITKNENTFFIERSFAENEPSFKQLIPYCILIYYDHKNQITIFNYQRTKKAGETRLHDKRSIGVGGHINPIDENGEVSKYEAGLLREVEEEVGAVKFDGNLIAGLIYDDSNDVGKVHFGIAHFLVFDTKPDVKLKEEALTDPRWSSIMQLQHDIEQYENWSKLIINAL